MYAHPASSEAPFDDCRPTSFRTRPLTLLIRWLSNSEQRRALRELDDTQLKDVGITREQAWREGAKHFWE